MWFRGVILVAGLATAGCSGGSEGLFRFEVQFLREDVIDFMTIVLQTGENAFVGDVVRPRDVVEAAGPGNAFAVTYDLPDEPRVGLGAGSGRVTLRVTEDGVPHEDPLAFSAATTGALVVEIEYDQRYDGEAPGGRLTQVDLVATLTLTRADATAPFEVEYFIEGTCWLAATYCEVTARFAAPGRPRDGIVPGFGDGAGLIDDPDVLDLFDLDIDWFDGFFVAEGEVGCCGAKFDEGITYREVGAG